MPVSNLPGPQTKQNTATPPPPDATENEDQSPSSGQGQGPAATICDLDASPSGAGQSSLAWGEGSALPWDMGLLWWQERASEAERVRVAVQSRACDLTSLSQSPQLAR